VFAPAGVPAPVAKKLEATLRQAIQSPDVVEKLKAMAVKPGGGPAEEFARMIDGEIKSYSEIAKAANLSFAD
jgi:tripartite-type tricarboxylate transporter receptor subunit TctC